MVMEEIGDFLVEADEAVTAIEQRDVMVWVVEAIVVVVVAMC